MKATGELFSDYQVEALHQEAPTPLYYRLYSLLKQAILNGSISHGAQMPTEQVLAESFSVSRITAKRAMDELAGEALIERRRGRGSHVIYEYRPQPVKAPLVGMLQEIESMARHSDVRVITCSRARLPASVQELLGPQPTAGSDRGRALHTVRVRSRDEQPFGYYDSWTFGLQGRISRSEIRQRPRLEIFREHGLAITHVTQVISAVAASPVVAEALETEPGSPLLSLVRHSFTGGSNEQLVDYLQLYYHPQRFQYRMDLNLDEQ